jgi:hypothetical protein
MEVFPGYLVPFVTQGAPYDVFFSCTAGFNLEWAGRSLAGPSTHPDVHQFQYRADSEKRPQHEGIGVTSLLPLATSLTPLHQSQLSFIAVFA